MRFIGGNKSVIGLFVDGADVKLARLAKKGGKVFVEELKSATLATKLEERKPTEAAAIVGDDKDPFKLPELETMALPAAEASGEDNNAVLLGLLSQYKPKSYSLAYCVSEPSIYYHQFENDFGLQGKKLKLRIIEELKNTRTFQPTPDAVDSIPTNENGILCVVREEGMSLLNHLENIKGFLGNRLPTIAGIDSSEISLMSMVRLNYEVQPEEVSVLVYVGVEFTRLIFMRGDQFYQFAPIISEGYDSPNLHNMIYSRLLLEQDNLNIQRINRIILAGESRRIELRNFLQELLPEQEVDYLRAPNVDTSHLPSEVQEMVSDYAAAIGVAWKFLDGSSKKIYPTNLLPDSVREGQRVFKLSWHGYVLLGAIFAGTLFFTTQIQQKQQHIAEKQSVLDVKNSQIAENAALQGSIQSLQQQLASYNASMALYDSLVPGADKFSKAFSRLSNSIDDLNSIWVTEFAAGETGQVTMNGFSAARSRIPRLSAVFDKSELKEVTTEEIRDETVYRYKIDVPSIEEKK